MTDFALHPLLARDTIPVAMLSCCQLLLMNDSQYPWLILVPTRAGLTDWDQLEPEEAGRVWGEVTRCSRLLRELFQPDKLNIASLGNVVSQLHIHVIARFREDACWPRPVWGQCPAMPYDPEDAGALVTRLRELLASA